MFAGLRGGAWQEQGGAWQELPPEGLDGGCLWERVWRIWP